MGAGIFLVLVLLGFLLSTVGGIIGLVDAFRVSPVWGLLSFFVPFALLVFCIKFWNTRKWAKNSLILSLAGLVSMLAGLPFLGGFVSQRMAEMGDQMEQVPVDQVPIDQVPVEGVPTEPLPTEPLPTEQAPLPGTGEEAFAEPLVPAAPQLASIARAELIQSTDPEERLQQINSSRPDPFATVPIPPPPRVAPPPPPAGAPTPVVPNTTGGAPTPIAPNGTPVATAPSPGQTGGGGQAGTPGAGQAGGGGQTGTPSAGQTSGGGQAGAGQGNIALAPLPELPQPTQAEAVVITGVVTIGNRNYAIIQSPDEPTGRYVAAGQRVAGGQVLVKRIDMRGSDPVVVLEQNGVEVSRSVGLPEEPQEAAAT